MNIFSKLTLRAYINAEQFLLMTLISWSWADCKSSHTVHKHVCRGFPSSPLTTQHSMMTLTWQVRCQTCLPWLPFQSTHNTALYDDTDVTSQVSCDENQLRHRLTSWSLSHLNVCQVLLLWNRHSFNAAITYQRRPRVHGRRPDVRAIQPKTDNICNSATDTWYPV